MSSAEVGNASEQVIPALRSTIKVSDLTLHDWIQIGEAAQISNTEKWACYRWMESADSSKLQTLTLKDWEIIQEEIGHSGNWAYYRYKACQ